LAHTETQNTKKERKKEKKKKRKRKEYKKTYQILHIYERNDNVIYILIVLPIKSPFPWIAFLHSIKKERKKQTEGMTVL